MSTQPMNFIRFDAANLTTLSLKGIMLRSGITVLIAVALSHPSISEYLPSHALKNELARVYDLIDGLKSSASSSDLKSLRSKLPDLPSTDGRISRKPRDVTDTTVEVADKLKNMVTVNTNDMVDVSFTSVREMDKHKYYVAILNTTHVSVHELINNESTTITTYPLSSGKSITAIGLSNCMLLAVQTADEGTIIFKFLPSERSIISAHTLPFFDVVDTVIWDCKHLGILLGIATESSAFVFKWIGEQFDEIQPFHFGGQKIVPFHHETVPYLAVAGSKTIISEYSLSTGKFMIVQKLPKSHNAASFSVKIRNFEEKYVCVCHEAGTIVYKEAFNRYVPFQQLPTSIACIPTVRNGNIVLALQIEDEAKIYQYDGWRFVDIGWKVPDVGAIRGTNVFGGNLLIRNVRGHSWRIVSFVWRKIDSYDTLTMNTMQWCSDALLKAKRTFDSVKEFSGTLTISNGYVDKMKIENVNDKRTALFKTLSDKYHKVLDTLADQKSNLTTKKVSGNWNLTSLRAKKVKFHTPSKWKIENIVSEDEKFSRLSNIRRIDNSHQSLLFENLRLTTASMLKCPLPSFALTRTIVSNDTKIRSLQNDALKTVGDQEIFGIHVYEKLNVTKGTFPIETTHGSIKSKLLLPEVRTTSLNINGSGLLLHLNGTSQVISGSIVASKVTLNGTVDLHVKCMGDAFKHLHPAVVVQGTQNFAGDYNLQNVQIQRLFRASEISREDGLPLSKIVENAVPLNENTMKHVTLTNVSWTAVNLTGGPNFVTPSSKIVGTKKFPQTVTLTNPASLPIPKIDVPFCAPTAYVHSLKNSFLTLGRVYVKNLQSEHVVENGTLNETIFSLVSSLEEADISEKTFERVTVKNLTLLQPEKLKLSLLKNVSDNWVRENVFKGPITVANFQTESLDETVRFNFPLLKAIKLMRCDGNIRTGTVNNINFDSFASNVLYKNDTSTRNITFLGGFSCSKIHAEVSPITFPRYTSNLFSKRILGNLSTTSLTLPYNYSYNSLDGPKQFVLTGTAHFEEEPTFGTINGLKVNDLLKKAWMKDESTVLTGRGIKMANVTFRSEIISEERIFDELITTAPLNLLSRTKAQSINVPAHFNSTRINNIVGGPKSKLKLSAGKFNELLWDTLTDEGMQIINSSWRFDEIYASGDLKLENKVNGLNLSTDVVRFDSNVNIITGKKTVHQLATRTLHYGPFTEWAKNAITVDDSDLIIVKGTKVFRSVDITKLTVLGTISGRKIDKILQKSGVQKIYSFKTIEGFVNASSFVIDGFINDVNITDLVETQLKKNNSVQRISGKITLQDGLQVVGNIRTNDSYQGVELRSINTGSENLESITEKMSAIMEIVDAIDAAVQNHAFFFRRLEPNMSTTLINNIQRYNTSLKHESDREMEALINSSSTELFSFEDNKFHISIDGNRAVCTDDETCPEPLTELNVPDVIDMSAKRTRNSLWIVLRLSSKMLVLRYDLWGQLRSYELPYVNYFRVETAPNSELMLIRPDGIWKLDGLGSPKNIIRIPFGEGAGVPSSDV